MGAWDGLASHMLRDSIAGRCEQTLDKDLVTAQRNGMSNVQLGRLIDSLG